MRRMATLIDEIRRGWRGTSRPSLTFSLGFAVSCLAVSTAARWCLSMIRPDVYFTPYFPAVFFATAFGGHRIGIATAAVGGILGVSLNFGDAPTASVPDFLRQVFMTPAGWTLIVVGNGVGFLFAVAVLAISIVSFPLLLDRDVGVLVAIRTSVRAVRRNPLIIAAWGLIVAALLVAGSLPFFVGLAVVMPVLGHATWHLYRKAVASDAVPSAEYQEDERPRPQRYAADFPAALFPTRR